MRPASWSRQPAPSVGRAWAILTGATPGVSALRQRAATRIAPTPPRPRPWAHHGGGGGRPSVGGPRPGAPANACAPWPPAVTEHRGTPGQRLLRRGGEGRQAPAGGRPTCHRGRGAEPGLPGLRGEPPAGPVPAWGPLLGQRPPGRPLAQQGRRWRALAAACCEFCPCLPGP